MQKKGDAKQQGSNPGLLHPGSFIQLSLKNTEQVIADLLAYRIDVGFVEGPVSDERLQRYLWRHDQLCVFSHPGHPLAGKVVTQEDLKNTPWVLREKGSGTRDIF